MQQQNGQTTHFFRQQRSQPVTAALIRS